MAPAAKKITLKSSDGKVFKVDPAVAMESQTIKNMIEEGHSGSTILLPQVASKILAKVIEYCKAHAEGAPTFDTDEELDEWDAEFIDVDIATLCDLISAAHYLGIESLRDLGCEMMDDMLKGKTPQEFHDTVCMVEAPAKTKKRKRRRRW